MLLHDKHGNEVYIEAQCVHGAFVAHAEDEFQNMTCLETDGRLSNEVFIVAESPKEVWRLRASELGKYHVADRLLDQLKAAYEQVLHTGHCD